MSPLRRHFGHPFRTFGDDDELRDGDDQEHHQTHHHLPANHEIAERLDDVPGVAVQQDQARSSDRQRQAKQRAEQNQRRQRGEIHRVRDVEREDQDQQAQGNVDGDQAVHQKGRQRDDHHRDGHQHECDDDHVGTPGRYLRQAIESGHDAH
jgi:hypothetical protein